MGFKIHKEKKRIPKTVRIEEPDYEVIQNLAEENDTSFNDVINSMIKYAIKNME